MSTHQARRKVLVGGLLVVTILGSLAAGNWDALAALVSLWAPDGYSSEFLVLMVAAWLLWRDRHKFAAIELREEWRGLLVVVPVGIGLLLVNLVDVRVAQLALLLVAACGVVWCILGQAAMRLVVYPIAFLFLALPVWDSTKPLLQEMTVNATVFMLRAVGLPVFIDETYIHVPSFTAVVIASCSGSSYFHAGVTLGLLFAYLNLRRTWRRMAAVALFAVMAIVSNWIRVFILVLLGPQNDGGHANIGWGTFAISMVPALWLALRLRDRGDSVLPLHDNTVFDGYSDNGTAISSTPKLAAIASLAIVLLTMVPMAADRYITSLPAPDIELMPFQPNTAWSGPHETNNGWHPFFNDASSEMIAAYRKGDTEVSLYIAYYRTQDQDAEAVNEGNEVYNPENWYPRGDKARESFRRIVLDGTPERTWRIAETQLEGVGDGSKRLVWHWFRVAGHDVASPWRAKLLQVIGLAQRRNDAAAIVWSVAGADLDNARQSLESFLKENFDRIEVMINPEANEH